MSFKKGVTVIVLGFIFISSALGNELASGAGDNRALTNLQSEFERRGTSIRRDLKTAPRAELDLVHQLLNESGDFGRKREFMRLCAKHSDTEFDGLLAQAFVELGLQTGEIKSLEPLLKTNFVEFIAGQPIEYVLAVSKVPNAILLLPHTYVVGSTNTSNSAILRCLVRAFPELAKSSETDNALVVECEKWWNANALLCVVNYKYPYRINSARGDPSGTGEGLFKLSNAK